MLQSNCNANTPDCREVPIYRPEDIQEMFAIKQRTYYHRLKFLGMEAYKDEDGKPYLDEAQVALLEELDEYIKRTGKMDGFNGIQNGGLVRAESREREHLTFVTPKSGFMSSYFESLARNQF